MSGSEPGSYGWEPDMHTALQDNFVKEFGGGPWRSIGQSTNPKDIAGSRKAPLRFVPPALAICAAPACADGAGKYGPFNWRSQPIGLVFYIEAIERHLAAIKDGQDIDPTSGKEHWSHIAATVGIIADAQAHGTLVDDRFTAGPAPQMLAALVKKD